MKIYNEEKTKILIEEDLNYEEGYLKEDIIINHIAEVKEVKEQGHYETIKEYPNGGKDVKYVIDVPAVIPVEAHDEEEKIYIFKKYTAEELKENKRKQEINDINSQITKLKNNLSSTDYKAIKYAEGYYTEEEYSTIKIERENIRIKIRSLEEELENI